MSRVIKITVAVMFALFLSMSCIGPGLFFVPILLIGGWIPAATRLFKAWHPGASTIGWVIVALVLITGTQLFLRWVYRNVNAGSPEATQKRWRLRWTLAGYAALFCLLVAVTSMILITHQMYWMAKAHDPLFSDGFREKIALRYDAHQLKELADQVKWDSSKTRAAFFEGKVGRGHWILAEEAQPVWIEGSNNVLRAVILVPRHPLIRAKARVLVIKPEGSEENRQLDELPGVLESFGLGSSFGGTSRAGGLLP